MSIMWIEVFLVFVLKQPAVLRNSQMWQAAPFKLHHCQILLMVIAWLTLELPHSPSIPLALPSLTWLALFLLPLLQADIIGWQE